MTYCENEDCREPHGKPAYVFLPEKDQWFCLSCYLIYEKFMDPIEAEEICFEGNPVNH